MWTKPWNMKEGFLIGGGLIFAGLMLELSVGPVAWDAFAWPANGIVLAGFMVNQPSSMLLRHSNETPNRSSDFPLCAGQMLLLNTEIRKYREPDKILVLCTSWLYSDVVFSLFHELIVFCSTEEKAACTIVLEVRNLCVR